MPTNHARTTALLLSACALACEPVQGDAVKSRGGMAPEPTALLRGSVVYNGPRPPCEYEGDRPARVLGRVVLTLFDYDNPPPPEGRASSAKNLLTLAGSALFSLEDCRAEGADVADTDTVARSASFEFPSVELQADAPSALQVRGFYDADADMLPFFRVRNLPTYGDVIGAALNDPSDPSAGLLRIALPARSDAPRGVLREHVTVLLGSPVLTERPIFEISRDPVLDGEAPIVPQIDYELLRVDPLRTLDEVWRLSCSEPAERDACGLTLSLLEGDAYAEARRRAGIGAELDPLRYAFFFEPVDVKTVRRDAPDLALPDGLADPHPIFGASLGLRWVTPIVIAQRAAYVAPGDDTPSAAAVELAAGIPSVTLIGTPLPSTTASVLPEELRASDTAVRRVALDALPVAIPPIAVVDLDPVDPACRVLFVPPGNVTSSYELRVAECRDVPSGAYGLNVLQGSAGGERVEELDPEVSASGVVLAGGRFSGQAWSIPNELGDPAQMGARYAVESQGRAGMLTVYDDHPDESGDCSLAPDPAQLLPTARAPVLRGLCGEGEAPIGEETLASVKQLGVDGSNCLPSRCCENVRHLCGLPLCDTAELAGHTVRTSPRRIVGEAEGGRAIPECVPFAMPALCCDG
jgi:hypothetical protein